MADQYQGYMAMNQTGYGMPQGAHQPVSQAPQPQMAYNVPAVQMNTVPQSQVPPASGMYSAPPANPYGMAPQGGYYPAQTNEALPYQAQPQVAPAMPQQYGTSAPQMATVQAPLGQPQVQSGYPQAGGNMMPAQPQWGSAPQQQPSQQQPAGGYYQNQTAPPQQPARPDQMSGSNYYGGVPLQPQMPPAMDNRYGQPYAQPGPGPRPMGPPMMRGGAPGGYRGGYREDFNAYNGRDGHGGSDYQEDPTAVRYDTVYVKGIPGEMADHETLKKHFGTVGNVKINAKTGMPMIWIFKEGGTPRGDAVVTFATNASANEAIKYYTDHDMNGIKLEVRLATNAERPKIVPPGQSGGNFPYGGAGPRFGGSFDPGFRGPRFGGPRRGGPSPRGAYRGGGGNRPEGATRDGDWQCPQCENSNFAWRDSCNRCQTSKVTNGQQAGGPMRDGSRGARPTPY